MSIYSLDDNNNRYNMDEIVALKEQVASLQSQLSSLQSSVESSISSLNARPYIVRAKPYMGYSFQTNNMNDSSESIIVYGKNLVLWSNRYCQFGYRLDSIHDDGKYCIYFYYSDAKRITFENNDGVIATCSPCITTTSPGLSGTANIPHASVYAYTSSYAYVFNDFANGTNKDLYISFQGFVSETCYNEMLANLS